MKKIILGILVMTILIGNVGLANSLQQSKEIIKVPGASEDFILDDYFPISRPTFGEEFAQLIGIVFYDSVEDKNEPEWEKFGRWLQEGITAPTACLVRGATSNRKAVIIKDLVVTTLEGKRVKSNLVLVYYINELKRKVESRMSYHYLDPKKEYRCKHKEVKFLMLDFYNDMRRGVYFLIPEAEEAVQKFVDSIKAQIGR